MARIFSNFVQQMAEVNKGGNFYSKGDTYVTEFLERVVCFFEHAKVCSNTLYETLIVPRWSYRIVVVDLGQDLGTLSMICFYNTRCSVVAKNPRIEKSSGKQPWAQLRIGMQSGDVVLTEFSRGRENVTKHATSKEGLDAMFKMMTEQIAV